MAYIEPGTNIKLLNNVPLDNTYQHTIYFASKDAQTTYFSGLTAYNLTDYSYQRVQRGRARVGRKADDLYNCNYMMFQNTNFGSKWFYAFINSVEYVNNQCSEIEFEIDVLQTWFFDFDLKYCFVEREHPQTDVIGEHIEPENVALGEYVMNSYSPIELMTSMAVIVAIVDVQDTVDGTLYDGIYGGAQLWVYDSTDVTSINDKLAEYADAPDSVISIYMCPLAMVNGGSIPSTHKLPYGAGATKYTITLSGVNSDNKLDGYKPKCKKLYTYPYCFYHVDNASGSELNLRYEFFDSGKPVVEISGTVTQPITVTLRPCSYKGVSKYSELGGYTTFNAESIQLNNYPICSWNTDMFKAWVAQNAVPIAINTATGLTQDAIGTSYDSQSAGFGNVASVGNLLTQAYRASIAADICRGNFNNGGTNVANNKQQFYGGRCSITKQYARMIDDYFYMFGYAVKRCKIPNTHSRPYWNYVKTVGCVAKGSVPADDMKKICQIHDNGITYWKSGENVGIYSYDNSPTS